MKREEVQRASSEGLEVARPPDGLHLSDRVDVEQAGRYEHEAPKYINITQSDSAGSAKRRRICGLSYGRFWAIGVFALVILAAAIGGGLGGGLAAQSHKSDTASASTSLPVSATTSSIQSPSATSSANAAASSTPDSFAGCPTANNTLLTLSGVRFLVGCQMDFDRTVTNILNTVQTSFMDCLKQCTAYNSGVRRNFTCGAVAWDQDAPYYVINTQRCWLKDSRATMTYIGPVFETVISAQMVD